MNHIPERQRFKLRYEDLKDSTFHKIKEILDFMDLGFTGGQVSRMIADANGYKIRKYGEFAKISGPLVDEPDGFIRKANYGYWREEIGL